MFVKQSFSCCSWRTLLLPPSPNREAEVEALKPTSKAVKTSTKVTPRKKAVKKVAAAKVKKKLVKKPKSVKLLVKKAKKGVGAV
ncbi:hypothetical protein ACJRO7_029056 [Eucalyptus globulus]|uniref:Uncharacterized protein n=1 Tax=Eucalyptus globulus TaxID=34317 RepID=A0ABD3K2Q6_EUCGL